MVLEMYHKNFKHLPWIESIEVAKPTIFLFWYPKITFFRVFFAVFSGTANEVMIPAWPPNTHPSPLLMQKEPTDFFNLPRRRTISGVQNVTLYCKIDTVIQLFERLYKWPLT